MRCLVLMRSLSLYQTQLASLHEQRKALEKETAPGQSTVCLRSDFSTDCWFQYWMFSWYGATGFSTDAWERCYDCSTESLYCAVVGGRLMEGLRARAKERAVALSTLEEVPQP